MKILILFTTLALTANVPAETAQSVHIGTHGEPRPLVTTVTTTSQLPDGTKQITANTSQPDSSGQLVLTATATATVTPEVDGVKTATRVESRVDVNGELKPDRQIVERTTKVSDNEVRVERDIQVADRANAGFNAAARETAVMRTQGDTTITEMTVQKPTGGTAWRAESKVHTIEVKAADGSIQREIVESGRSLHERATGSADLGDSLQPQRKIIEREVPQADGTKMVERQFFRRDVNGEWKPTTFSTESGRPVR